MTELGDSTNETIGTYDEIFDAVANQLKNLAHRQYSLKDLQSLNLDMVPDSKLKKGLKVMAVLSLEGLSDDRIGF